MRSARWLVCLACLGCHAVQQAPPPPLMTPPSAASSLLGQAAACLSAGNDAQACSHLAEFIDQQPGHRNARFLLAELQFQRGQYAAARDHYQHAVAVCQEDQCSDIRKLLHCHNRLLAVAEALEDDYEAQLERGIGLVLLARARATLGDPTGELPVESLLCRAAGYLTAAHGLRPDEARPCWYLHETWRQLAQPQLQERWRQQAEAAASFSYLTPVEHRSLVLAGNTSSISNMTYIR